MNGVAHGHTAYLSETQTGSQGSQSCAQACREARAAQRWCCPWPGEKINSAEKVLVSACSCLAAEWFLRSLDLPLSPMFSFLVNAVLPKGAGPLPRRF